MRSTRGGALAAGATSALPLPFGRSPPGISSAMSSGGLQHTSKADTTRVRHQLNVGADHPRPAADRAQARRFNRRSIFLGCPRKAPPPANAPAAFLLARSAGDLRLKRPSRSSRLASQRSCPLASATGIPISRASLWDRPSVSDAPTSESVPRSWLAAGNTQTSCLSNLHYAPRGTAKRGANSITASCATNSNDCNDCFRGGAHGPHPSPHSARWRTSRVAAVTAVVRALIVVLRWMTRVPWWAAFRSGADVDEDRDADTLGRRRIQHIDANLLLVRGQRMHARFVSSPPRLCSEDKNGKRTLCYPFATQLGSMGQDGMGRERRLPSILADNLGLGGTGQDRT